MFGYKPLVELTITTDSRDFGHELLSRFEERNQFSLCGREFTARAITIGKTVELTAIECPKVEAANLADSPSAPQWSGEGLPPVGVDCEYMKRGGADWFHCSVIAEHDGGVVVAVHEDDLSYSYWNDTGHFRPIRTPEQIADDERERFAQELVAAMGKGGGQNALYQARRMYDLGYRKP